MATKNQTQKLVNNIPKDKKIGFSKEYINEMNNCSSLKEIRNILAYILRDEGIKATRVKPRKPKKKNKQPKPVIQKKPKLTLEQRLNEFRKDLIKNQTQSEIKFKQLLNQIGVEYIFQHIIHDSFKGYIADFYLTRQNIVIEIDGGYHDNEFQQIKDEDRTQFMLAHGIHKVIRFDNNALNKSLISNTRQRVEAIIASN